MPYDVVKDTSACSASKPWAVKNSDTGALKGCHESHAKARMQQKALYVALRKEGKLSEHMLIPVSKMFSDLDSLTTEDRVTWVQAYPFDSWDHPIYGTTTVNREIGSRYVENLKSNVRGQDIATNYEHGEDPAKGAKASGWIRDAELRDDGVYLQVEFTPTAIQEIKNGEWKYFSAESYDEWEHPHTGQKYQYVLAGGALTNRPWVKGMLPINFSEVMVETEQGIKPKNESKEMEHSEPGTGNPPQPRTDEDGSDDIAIREGWRRDTPPDIDSKGGNTTVGELTEKDLIELRRLTEVDDDSKILERVQLTFGELTSLKRDVAAADQEKEFAEKYPQYWQEHNRLMEENRDNAARNFSEGVSKIRKAEGYGLKETNEGLSTVAKEKVEEVHKLFAEGKATVKEFEECIKAIVNGGIVKFGEIGNGKGDNSEIPVIDTSTAAGVANARKVFAELVSTVQRESIANGKPLDYNEAMQEAAKRAPDLAEAYRITLPG